MGDVRNNTSWWNRCEDCDVILEMKNAWLCPWCFSCASKHFDFPKSRSGQAIWDAMASEMREKTLASGTVESYQRGFTQAEWPLDSPFRIMAYLTKAPPSDSSLKQWMAMARKIHQSRLWKEPNFQHPLVKNFIEAIKHRTVKSTKDHKNTTTFTKQDLQALFNCVKKKKAPTDHRNWAILVTQLFGVRRASEVLALKTQDIRIAEGTLLIRVVSSKTDKRKQGIFFKLPNDSCFGFNPSDVLADYILSTKGNGNIIFQAFNPDTKKFISDGISVNGWNRALKKLCLRANILPRTSHALRRSAITLSPIHLVEAIAQTGGWKSLCFWEVYRKFDIDQRAEASSNIGIKEEESNYKNMLLLK